MVGVANAQGTDVLVTDRLPHHRVPERGRIARSLDREPRQRGAMAGGYQPRFIELAKGGDLTRVGVDEERGHPAPG